MQAQARERDAQVASRRGARRAAIATLAAAALALAAGIAVVLSHTAVRRSGSDDVTATAVVRSLRGAHRICQRGERIPTGTAALRVSIAPGSEPRATMALAVADEGGATVATADRYRWSRSAAVFSLRRPVARERAGSVCVQVDTHGRAGAVELLGASADPSLGATNDGTALGARMRIDDLRAGRESWWALAPAIATRIGRTRPWLGSAAALVAALLVLGSISGAAWLLVRTS